MAPSSLTKPRIGGRSRRGCFVLLSVTTAIVLLTIVFYPLWLPQIYIYLDVSEPPQKADVLVVLGGGSGRRVTYAVELYKAGFAPRLFVSGNDDDSIQQSLKIIREGHLPANALTINDQATTTYGEAQQVLRLLLRMNVKSALIVTDPFHTRRALATYNYLFYGQAIQLTIVSPDDGIDPNSWWISNFRDNIVQELLKLPYYWFVYGVQVNSWNMSDRIYLSPPHMSGKELALVQQVFADNWIAPVGPQLAAFEEAFCKFVGVSNAVALSSGTAAIHLALLTTGVLPGDEVIVSSLTFAGSVYPILYVGAKPIFIDSDARSWNLDPNLLSEFLEKRANSGKLPKALIVVHLYGQSADMDAISAICERYGIIVIEDAAEAVGSQYHGRHPGAFGRVGVFSFNGNKIMTTSSGGMLVSNDRTLIDTARKLSTQSREPTVHYEHTQIGYNYRMSNVLAAIGCGQLNVVETRVVRKREIYNYYRSSLDDVPGLTFVPDMPYGRHTHWLSVMLINPEEFGADREQVRIKLEEYNIESRPLWKPMHMQPIFQDYDVVGGAVSEMLFQRGLCLPSGTAMTNEQLDRVVSIIRGIHQA